MKVKDFSRVIILLLSFSKIYSVRLLFSLSLSLSLYSCSPSLLHTDTQDKLQGKAEIVHKDHDKTKEAWRRMEKRAKGRDAMTLLSRTWIHSRLSLSTEWKWRTLCWCLQRWEERWDKACTSSLISLDFNKTH